jgi:hypothetical protein
MIENVLRDLGGIAVFGIISVCLFFSFFSAMLIWASCLKKAHLNSMGMLPLDDGRFPVEPESSTSKSHE